MIKFKPLSVRFTESAEEEVKSLVKELHLVPIVSYLNSDDPIPPGLRDSLQQMLSIITDLFSTSLPDVHHDPEQTLRTVSRDINLARLLRERGLFRLYMLLNTKDENNVPVYMTVINSDTGNPYSTQEEFIGWFCQEASIARSLVFMRMATIERVLSLGVSMEDTFEMIVQKPWVIRETLNMIANWDGGNMKSVDPWVVSQVADRVAPAEADAIRELADQAKTDPEAMEELKRVAKPVFAELLQEVSNKERSKDALDFVRYDILGSPEISYSWDVEGNYLLIEMINKQVAPDGTEYMAGIVSIPFIPDAPELPEQVRKDLIRRLPIKNKSTLDL